MNYYEQPAKDLIKFIDEEIERLEKEKEALTKKYKEDCDKLALERIEDQEKHFKTWKESIWIKTLTTNYTKQQNKKNGITQSW